MKKQRIHISSPSGVVYTTKITDAETGEPIPGIERVEITIDVNDKDGMVKAKLFTRRVEVVDTIAEAEVVDAGE